MSFTVLIWFMLIYGYVRPSPFTAWQTCELRGLSPPKVLSGCLPDSAAIGCCCTPTLLRPSLLSTTFDSAAARMGEESSRFDHTWHSVFFLCNPSHCWSNDSFWKLYPGPSSNTFLLLNLHFASESSKSELLQPYSAKMWMKNAPDLPKNSGLGGTASRHCRGGPSGRPLPRGPLREATATSALLYLSNFLSSAVLPCAFQLHTTRDFSNQQISFHRLSVQSYCNMASVTGSHRRPAPWARATPLEQLARGNKTPFPIARAAVNCISRLRASLTSRRLPPLTPNLAHSAAEEAGLQQGDHFFALKPGQNIRVIESMILESPVFPTNSIADPPYNVRSCAVSVAGIHALPALAAMPAVRTPVTVVGGDGFDIPVPITATMPLILYGPLALAL
jgi:hypothetical protein